MAKVTRLEKLENIGCTCGCEEALFRIYGLNETTLVIVCSQCGQVWYVLNVKKQKKANKEEEG